MFGSCLFKSFIHFIVNTYVYAQIYTVNKVLLNWKYYYSNCYPKCFAHFGMNQINMCLKVVFVLYVRCTWLYVMKIWLSIKLLILSLLDIQCM